MTRAGGASVGPGRSRQARCRQRRASAWQRGPAAVPLRHCHLCCQALARHSLLCRRSPGNTPTPAGPRPADKVEAALQERARLDYTATVVRDAAVSTRTVLQRLRLALAAGGVARGVARGLAGVRSMRRPERGAENGAAGEYELSSPPRY